MNTHNDISKASNWKETPKIVGSKKGKLYVMNSIDQNVEFK
jgi:hypothetical protein